MAKTTTVKVQIGDLQEVKAVIDRLERDRRELIDTLACSPHTTATWINDAESEYAEGWAGILTPDKQGTCRTPHLCCDGYLVSRRVMELIVEHDMNTPGEFEVANDCTVFRADVEAVAAEMQRRSEEAEAKLLKQHDGNESNDG